MVTLVANHFLQASGMASTGPLLNALDLSLGVLERLAQPCSCRPGSRPGPSPTRSPPSSGPRPARFWWARWVRPSFILAIFASGSAGLFHSSFEAFLLAPPIQPRQRLPRGRANARRLRQTLQELLVGLSGIPTHDAPHRRVRFQRRRVDRNRLSAQKTRPRQALLDPGEHVTVGFPSRSAAGSARSSNVPGPAPPTQAPGKLRTPSESAARHAIPRSESRPSKYPTSKSRK